MTLPPLFGDLVHALPEAILIVTPGGEVLAANAVAARLLRQPLNRLAGVALDTLVAGNGSDLPQQLARWSRTQSLLPGRLVFHALGGDPIDCRCDGSALAASPGSPPLLLLRLRPRLAATTAFRRLNAQIDQLQKEVEERKLAELALRESEERRIMALHATGVGSWAWDMETDRVVADLTVLHLFGVEDQRPIERLDQLMARSEPESHASLLATLRGALTDSAMHFISTRLQLEDGSDRWLATQVKALRVPDAPRRIVAVTIDVTEQRASEEQQQETRRLESVGRLAGGVAHEANNQMTVVLGCADFILRRKDLPPVVREDVEQLRRAAERTARITTQLLAFGRRQMLRIREVDLNAVVSNLLTALERAIENRGSLHIHLAPRIRPVMGDPDQLEQVLLNLVFNARDAIQPGGHVLVATQPVSVPERLVPPRTREAIAPGEYVMIAVSDNGCGMDQPTVDRIFEPFFTTKDIGKGTGLGLAMVHGSVKQSGGHIWVESVPGEGTTFRILLPVANAVPSPKEAKPPPVAPPAVRGTILVVDDDDAVREIVSRTLESDGFAVVRATGGENALERLAAGPPVDLVLTDLIMTGMRGEELGKQIRTLGLSPSVIYMSGLHDRVDHKGSRDHDTRVIRKPIAPEALLDIVRSALIRPGT